MRIILPLFLVLALLPASVSALTVGEVVALSQAGVSDEVLLALIDRDRTIFTIGPDQLVALKRDNVSEKIVLAMLRSGRQEPPPAPAPEAANVTLLAPVEGNEITVGHGPDRPNTYHEHDPVFGTITIYTVPYVTALPTRDASSSCAGGRQTLPGSRTDRTGGLADASQKFVNDRLLAMLAGTDAGQTDCQQTVPARPGRRPQR